MSDPITFRENIAFGLVEVVAEDGGCALQIPARLFDDPALIDAIKLVAINGGKKKLEGLSFSEVLVVDPIGLSLRVERDAD